MQLGRLDLNLLVALDALLSEATITAASRRVHLSQSAMSGVLGRLRDYFGDELLVPVGRRMIRTAMGDALAAPTREILLSIKKTIATIPAFDAAKSCRRFSLMMSDYVSTVLMREVLRRAEIAAPRVGFEILSNDFIHPLELLEKADVDFLVMPTEYLTESHPSVRLFEDSYSCVISADNKVVGDSISKETYLALGHVSLQFGRMNTPVVDEFLHKHIGDQRRIEVIAMNFNSVIQCIIGTGRIAIVQTRLAEFYARAFPIRLVPTPFEIPPITEALQWHSCFDNDPGSKWLRDIFMSVAGDFGLRTGCDSAHASTALAG